MDCLSLEVLINELSPQIVNLSIQRIKLASDRVFVFALRSRQTEHLLLSLAPDFPGLFLSDENFISDSVPSDVLMLLRKYLVGSRIHGISKKLHERVVALEIQTSRLSEQGGHCTFVLELIPNRVRAFLINEQKEILASLPMPNQISGRYQEPSTQNRVQLSSLDQASFCRLFAQCHSATALAKGLGLGLPFATEIVHCAQGEPELGWHALESLLSRVKSGRGSPRIYYPPQSGSGEANVESRSKTFISPLPLAFVGTMPYESFVSMNDLYSELFRRRLTETRLRRRAREEKQKIAVSLRKKTELKRNLQADLEVNQEAAIFKSYADLLYSQENKAPRGLDCLKVINVLDLSHPHAEVEIPLDKTLSAIQNANRYSKLYQKSKRALPQIRKRLRVVESEIESLQRKRQALQLGLTTDSSHPAASELLDLPAVYPAAAEDQLPASQPLRTLGRKLQGQSESAERRTSRIFISSEGMKILVGKSSNENDVLTTRLARSEDFWLHVANYGGSHVVMRNPEKLLEPPKQSLVEAAQLAAYFSQARNAPKVEVHYTQKRFVSKPKGAKAGLVRLREYKSVLVRPQLLVTRDKAD